MIRRSTSPAQNAPDPRLRVKRGGDIDVARISLRHDLPLVGWVVVVKFRDRPDERSRILAREPLGASRLVHYTAEREWPAEKLLAVESIHPVRE